MRNWTTMSAGDWTTDGVQLDMLAGIEGDGYGTIALDELADEAAPVIDLPERADGALFGLTLTAATDGDALFSVVAA